MVVVASDERDLKRGVDFIGVTICFVVHDGSGNFLLQKRSQKCRDEQGTWDVGGGALEFGETMEQGVAREVKEELMVAPNEIQFLAAYEAHRTHNGNPTHWIALSHAAKVDPKKVKIGEPDRIDEIGWFNMNNLPSPLHSQMMKSLLLAQAAGIIK
jgi:8-oxo-dGTP diphosphatase